ncbi:GntR family transcriptional regulator [Nonomuraea sp. NPDC002799]
MSEGTQRRLGVERRTTAERVAAALREELLAGAFTPGQSLRDNELAERAGVARTTVREALTMLVREGLLTHHVNRGIEVRRLTAADLDDIYSAREVIESAGLARLLDGGAEALEPLEEAFERMASAAERGSAAAVADADIALHLALSAGTESQRLIETQRRALSELRMLFAVTDRAYDAVEKQVVQHRELLDVFRTGGAPAAQAALRAHLRGAAELIGSVIGREAQ